MGTLRPGNCNPGPSEAFAKQGVALEALARQPVRPMRPAADSIESRRFNSAVHVYGVLQASSVGTLCPGSCTPTPAKSV